MRIKNVVKVMNFHSLLRVDSAKRNADKYLFMQNELNKMLDIIINNRNFILDTKALKANENGKVLNIYYGSDLGFCGNLNSVINSELLKDNDNDNEKIIIGKKLRKSLNNIIKFVSREELEDQMEEIEKILSNGIKNMYYKEINLIYFEYISVTEMSLTKKRVFPTNLKGSEVYKNHKYNYDFSCEGDIENVLFNVLASYLAYQIRIANINCKASENIIRQNVTSESLKKIDEIEEENRKKHFRKIKQKNFQKIVESFSKITRM